MQPCFLGLPFVFFLCEFSWFYFVFSHPASCIWSLIWLQFSLGSDSLFLCLWLLFRINLKHLIYWLTLKRERKGEIQRERERFIVSLFHAFFGWFLYAPRQNPQLWHIRWHSNQLSYQPDQIFFIRKCTGPTLCPFPIHLALPTLPGSGCNALNVATFVSSNTTCCADHLAARARLWLSFTASATVGATCSSSGTQVQPRGCRRDCFQMAWCHVAHQCFLEKL